MAVSSIYCAAEVHGSSYDMWNFDLYAMVSAEMGTIRNEGYECLIIGDFNGHIGCDAKGIPGLSQGPRSSTRNGRQALWLDGFVLGTWL